ncbi:MAG: hypothetical protein NWE86_01265, partial [Candidatus Bathyarchaeota archaeon]|nr:hypothetical protein [Candidatus Bathyarchaeota archaeon]
MGNLDLKKSYFTFVFLFTIYFLSVILISNALANNNELIVSASFSLERNEKEELVSIIIVGKVNDILNKSISSAAISIQVEDPYGSTNHIALVYSKSDGGFIDQFSLKGDFLPGNYTVYLTASKIGYLDTNITLPFSIILFDFSLYASPESQTVKQGSAAKYEITARPFTEEKNFSISLKIADLQENAKMRPFFFRNASDNFETVSLLVLNTSKDTPAGTYNIEIIGTGGGKKHTTPVSLTVTEGETSIEEKVVYYISMIWTIPLIITLVIIIFGLLIFIKGKLQKFRKIDKKFEPLKDGEYIEIAKALAKLDELRSQKEIDEITYLKKKREYERKLRDWE